MEGVIVTGSQSQLFLPLLLTSPLPHYEISSDYDTT